MAHVCCCAWLLLTAILYCTQDRLHHVCRGFWQVVRTYVLWYKKKKGVKVGNPRHIQIIMCRERIICVGSSGACRPNVLTFGCRADMSQTCRQLSQPPIERAACLSTRPTIGLDTRCSFIISPNSSFHFSILSIIFITDILNLSPNPLPTIESTNFIFTSTIIFVVVAQRML